MQPMKPAAIFGYSVVAPFMATVLLVGFAAGCKSFTRYQARADAGNQVKVSAGVAWRKNLEWLRDGSSDVEPGTATRPEGLVTG